jgi:glutaminyl-tRNA synthetase
MSTESSNPNSNFVRAIIENDLAEQTHAGRVATRFPPEPNGYLHIGHAKSICLNFGMARDYSGQCHLRFDDTNPAKEDMEFVESIKRDVKWLGFDWGENLFHASDYFQKLYELALGLIRRGKAYVCSLSDDEIRTYRGSLGKDGTVSPYASRTVEENLEMFEQMRAGAFPNGAHVLRARIDMSASNMKMRDPLLYRIRHVEHDRTGNTWCIYPMYDYAHCLSDALEKITHSICTLEFENNRELYDWIVAESKVGWVPRQYEFARLNLAHTLMSKRKLLALVQNAVVDGWDDPRMPTIAGLRRRGYTPESIRSFCEMIGVAKANSMVDYAKLEYAVRDELNHRAPRVMAVLRPLKVVLTNYPEGERESLEAPYWPHDVPKEGTRDVPFTRELYIERTDFMESPTKKYYRLAPGREVRLRYAYVIRCDEIIKDDAGEVMALHCTYLPDTRSGANPDGRKIKGTIHWVSAQESVPTEIRLFDHLFLDEQPNPSEEDLERHINPESKVVITEARLEASLALAKQGEHFQFERHGYFIADSKDHRKETSVFNRVVTLRASWKKAAKPDSSKDTDPKTKQSKVSKNDQRERPEKRSRAEFRSEARRRDESLQDRFESYQSELNLGEKIADALTGSQDVANFFDSARANDGNDALVANWMVNELFKELKEQPLAASPLSPASFAALVRLVDEGELAARNGKAVLKELVSDGGTPGDIVERDGLRQLNDLDAIRVLVRQVIEGNDETLQRFRGGQKNLFGFFVGETIKLSRGRANPNLVSRALKEFI